MRTRCAAAASRASPGPRAPSYAAISAHAGPGALTRPLATAGRDAPGKQCPRTCLRGATRAQPATSARAAPHAAARPRTPDLARARHDADGSAPPRGPASAAHGDRQWRRPARGPAPATAAPRPPALSQPPAAASGADASAKSPHVLAVAPRGCRLTLQFSCGLSVRDAAEARHSRGPRRSVPAYPTAGMLGGTGALSS